MQLFVPTGNHVILSLIADILVFTLSSSIMVYFLKFMNGLKPYQRQPIMYFFLEGIVLFSISSAMRMYYALTLIRMESNALDLTAMIPMMDSMQIVSKILLISAYLVFLGMSWLLYDMVRRI